MRRALLVALLAILGGSAWGQATWVVESLIPESISIRVPATEIGFDVSQGVYPPPSFPAVYPATLPEGGLLRLQVFSNAEGFWSLSLKIDDIMDASGTRLVPAQQVMYRVNGGIWLRADGAPQVIFTQTGPTAGWLEVALEFALELRGTERAGSYGVAAVLSAQREGF